MTLTSQIAAAESRARKALAKIEERGVKARIARELDVNPVNISQFIAGTRKFSPAVLDKLLEILELQ